jgi:hypothetical protein
MSTYTLLCLIDGDKTMFDVVIPIDSIIDELKELIKKVGINATEHAVLAKELTLWKVRMTLVVTRPGIMLTYHIRRSM